MELVIVMTVIAILVSVAVPVYITHVKRAKEIVHADVGAPRADIVRPVAGTHFVVGER